MAELLEARISSVPEFIFCRRSVFFSDKNHSRIFARQNFLFLLDDYNEGKKADLSVDFSSPENSPSKMRDTYYHFLMKSLERPFEERGKAFLDEEKRLLIRSKADPEILPSLPLFPI